MLYKVLKYLKNFFVVSKDSKEWTIKDGTIDVPFLLDNQYFLIEGSVFNDGVYAYPVNGLADEVFNGTIAGLAIPNDLIELVEDIEQFNKDNAKAMQSPYSSETFEGYSYTVATNSNGKHVTWKDVFADRLSEWRKL